MVNDFTEKKLREMLLKYNEDAFDLSEEDLIKEIEKYFKVKVETTGYSKDIGRTYCFIKE